MSCFDVWNAELGGSLQVLLEDWWLVKSAGSVNGKQIGVGGTARAGQVYSFPNPIFVLVRHHYAKKKI